MLNKMKGKDQNFAGGRQETKHAVYNNLSN